MVLDVHKNLLFRVFSSIFESSLITKYSIKTQKLGNIHDFFLFKLKKTEKLFNQNDYFN